MVFEFYLYLYKLLKLWVLLGRRFLFEYWGSAVSPPTHTHIWQPSLNWTELYDEATCGNALCCLKFSPSPFQIFTLCLILSSALISTQNMQPGSSCSAKKNFGSSHRTQCLFVLWRRCGWLRKLDLLRAALSLWCPVVIFLSCGPLTCGQSGRCISPKTSAFLLT